MDAMNDATRAKQSAEIASRAVDARAAEVREVSAWLKARREENHFAEMIRKALRGTAR